MSHLGHRQPSFGIGPCLSTSERREGIVLARRQAAVPRGATSRPGMPTQIRTSPTTGSPGPHLDASNGALPLPATTRSHRRVTRHTATAPGHPYPCRTPWRRTGTPPRWTPADSTPAGCTHHQVVAAVAVQPDHTDSRPEPVPASPVRKAQRPAPTRCSVDIDDPTGVWTETASPAFGTPTTRSSSAPWSRKSRPTQNLVGGRCPGRLHRRSNHAPADHQRCHHDDYASSHGRSPKMFPMSTHPSRSTL